MIDLDGRAGALAGVPGVVAVSLGGSRARGVESPGPDWDVGVYYRPPLDVAALAALAAGLVGGPVAVLRRRGGTRPGCWPIPAVNCRHCGRRWRPIRRCCAPPGFAPRAAALLASPGATPATLTATVKAAATLPAETRAALTAPAPS